MMQEFEAYAVVWIVHSCMQVISQPFLFSGDGWRLGVLMANAVSAFRLRQFFWVALVLRNIARFISAPRLWDSEYWCFLTDLALLLRYKKWPEAAATIRSIWALLYLITGIWKLNYGFLDPSVSCGSIFAAQLLTASGFQDAVFLVRMAPTLVAVHEICIGLLFLCPKPSLQKAGIIACILLHTGITLTPAPNGVPTFSVIGLSRCVLFIDTPFSHLLSRLCSQKYFRLYHISFIIPVCAYILLRRPHLPTCIFFSLVWLLLTACLMSSPVSSPVQPQHFKPRTSKLVLFLTLFYALFMPILGLLDIGACTMFANLRVHGGPSNHFFLPTGLLHRFLFTNQQGAIFSGGEARILATNAQSILALYPGEITHLLTQETRTLLLSAGHLAREFNPKARAVIPWLRKPPAEHFLEVPFEIPAIALNNLIHTARSDEKFYIDYQILDPNTRQVQIQVHYETDDPFGHQNRSYYLSSDTGKTFGAEVFALAPSVPYWARKLLLFASYPALPDGPAGTDRISLPCNY